MKRFDELSDDDQQKVLDTYQPLPLFKHCQDDIRKLLHTGNYFVNEDLVVEYHPKGIEQCPL